MDVYSFLSSTIIPIRKNQRLDLKNSENYRAIAPSSVFGKILDKIVIEKQVEQLGTIGITIWLQNLKLYCNVFCSINGNN